MAKYYEAKILNKTYMVKSNSNVSVKTFVLGALENKWSIRLADVDDVLSHKDSGGEIIDLTPPVETQPVLPTSNG